MLLCAVLTMIRSADSQKDSIPSCEHAKSGSGVESDFLNIFNVPDSKPDLGMKGS